MSDIDDVLRADAAGWQQAVDTGARPEHRRTRTAGPPARRTLIPVIGGVASVMVVVGALVLGGVVGGHDSWTNRPTGTSALTERTWTDPASGGTVVFRDRTVRIDDGCDSGLRALTLAGTVLRIGGRVGRQSGCGGDGRAFDERQAAVARFDRVLDGRVMWARTGDSLHLSNARGTLELRTDGVPELEAVGPKWTLHRVADSTGNELAGSFTPGFVSIDPDGDVKANDLCADLTTTATFTDTTITFGALHHSGGHDCGDSNADAIPRIIDSVLHGKIDYAILGDQLILYGTDSALLVYTPSH